MIDSETKKKFDTTRADGQFRKPASNKKLLSLIGDFQFTPFSEGLLIIAHPHSLFFLIIWHKQRWISLSSGSLIITPTRARVYTNYDRTVRVGYTVGIKRIGKMHVCLSHMSEEKS